MSNNSYPDPDEFAKKLYYLLVISTVAFAGVVVLFIW